MIDGVGVLVVRLWIKLGRLGNSTVDCPCAVIVLVSNHRTPGVFVARKLLLQVDSHLGQIALVHIAWDVFPQLGALYRQIRIQAIDERAVLANGPAGTVDRRIIAFSTRINLDCIIGSLGSLRVCALVCICCLDAAVIKLNVSVSEGFAVS